MWLFAGLGNIGSEYVGTRHNIGFDVVDAVERRLSRSTGWKAGKSSYYFAKGFWRTEEVLLIKPTTYMNLSGRAIRDAMQFYKVELGHVIVICDDIAIPLGSLRLRLRGSDGGHNGIGSAIYELGTDEFARLRCGVGSDFHRGEQVRYVLSKFKSTEEPVVKEMVTSAEQGCLSIVELGVEKAMNVVNVAKAI